MEGSVLSFLKAEWKMSDTGSAHWASSCLYLLTLYTVLPYYKTTFSWGHPYNQARFQMHWDSKILLNYPQEMPTP
jgi:hypothetical protein